MTMLGNYMLAGFLLCMLLLIAMQWRGQGGGVAAIATKTAGYVNGVKTSASGTRAQVARVRAEYPNQLDYSGMCLIVATKKMFGTLMVISRCTWLQLHTSAVFCTSAASVYCLASRQSVC